MCELPLNLKLPRKISYLLTSVAAFVAISAAAQTPPRAVTRMCAPASPPIARRSA